MKKLVSYKVTINHENTIVSGGDDVSRLYATMISASDQDVVKFTIQGTIKGQDGVVLERTWIDRELKVGDKIEILLCENLKADMPIRETSYGVNEEIAPEGKLRYCSFCNKSEVQVKKLVLSEKANICDECLRYTYETLLK